MTFFITLSQLYCLPAVRAACSAASLSSFSWDPFFDHQFLCSSLFSQSPRLWPRSLPKSPDVLTYHISCLSLSPASPSKIPRLINPTTALFWSSCPPTVYFLKYRSQVCELVPFQSQYLQPLLSPHPHLITFLPVLSQLPLPFLLETLWNLLCSLTRSFFWATFVTY